MGLPPTVVALMRSRSRWATRSTTSFSRVPPGPMAPGSSPPWPGSSATMMMRSVCVALARVLAGRGRAGWPGLRRVATATGAAAGGGGRCLGRAHGGAGPSARPAGRARSGAVAIRSPSGARERGATGVAGALDAVGDGLQRALRAGARQSGLPAGPRAARVQVEHQPVLVGGHGRQREHLGQRGLLEVDHQRTTPARSGPRGCRRCWGRRA
jgi:hypothetical protein